MDPQDLQWAEHGPIRVGLKRRTNSDIVDVVATLSEDGKHYRIGFDGPDLVVAPMPEYVSIDWEADSLLTYDHTMADQVRYIFFALAKLFGMSSDAEAAYHLGEVEGQNKVLWQWVAATREDDPAS